MQIGVIGVGGGGNRIVDSLVSHGSDGLSALRGAFAIDSTQRDLEALEHVPESNRVVTGRFRNSDHSSGNLEVGSNLISEHLDHIAESLSASSFEQTDAYFVVTCLGGGMAGGVSDLITFLPDLTSKPVYAVVVSPDSDEADRAQLNAAVNFNSIYAAANGVILFENDRFFEPGDTDEQWILDANETIAADLSSVFSLIDTPSKTGTEEISLSTLSESLSTDGIAKIGRAKEQVESDTGLLSRVFGGNKELDEYYAERILETLTKQANSPVIDDRVDADQLEGPILFIAGSDRYLIDSGIEATVETTTRLGSPEPTVGVFPRQEPAVTVTILYGGISDAEILARFQRVYRDRYAGPSNGNPKPPFYLSEQFSSERQKQSAIDTDSHSTEELQPTGVSESTTDGETLEGDPSTSVKGEASTETSAESANNERKPSTDTRKVPEQSRPDPPDVDGVEQPPRLTFEDVIGLGDVKDRIREDVLLPARDDRFEKYDVGSVTGVLFHGPPGTGKTYLAKATAGELQYNYIEVKPSEIKSRYVGEGAENIGKLFDRARKAEPTLIFIDEIDSIAGDRSGSDGMTSSERSAINELLGELSDLNESDDDIILIAATNTLDDVDTAIKRSGRFDTTVHIGPPDFETRYGILEAELRNGPPHELDGIGTDELRSKTNGLVSSDMAEIGKSSIRKALSSPAETDPPVVTEEHIQRSINEIVEKHKQDSAAADVMAELPKLDFDDVAGMNDLKGELQEKVIEPARNPETYEKYGLDITNGVLLHGPPGTGKTHVSKALAGELEFNFIEITASDVVSKWIGEGTENIGKVFETALEHQPSLLFIDEIDAIASQRSGNNRMHQDQKQMVNEILTGMTDVQDEQVVVIGATNLESSLDDALTRSGRFDELIEVPPPDAEARVEMLKYHLAERPLAEETIDWDEIRDVSASDATGNQFVASDLELIAETAARLALGDKTDITQAHLHEAITETDASTSSYK